MNNNDKVKEMLREKFQSRNESPEKTVERTGTKAVPKEVSDSISSKLGIGKGAEKQKRLKELSKIGIKEVLKGIDTTDKTMKDIAEDFIKRGNALDEVKLDLKEMYNKKLVGKGSSQQASIESEYYQKLKEVDNIPSMRILQEEYTELETKLSDLNSIKSSYVAENQDLINEQLLKRKRIEIEEYLDC